MSKTKRTAFLTCLIIVAGCGYTPTTRDPIAVSMVAERHETRVYLEDDCVVTRRPEPDLAAARRLAAIATALTPVLVDGALSAVETFLREREAALTGTHAAHSTGRLYDVQGNIGFGCVTIVRGTFGARRADIDDTAVQGSLTGTHLSELGLATFPDFYFEAWASLEPTGDGESSVIMRVTPQVVHLARTAAKRSESGAKTVNILLLLSRTALDPKEPPDQDKAFAVLPFQFEAVEIGTEIRHDQNERSLLEHHAVATGIPPNTIEGNRLVVPFNMAAYVEETEQAGPFQKLLLEVFVRQRPGLESSLNEIIRGAIEGKLAE